MKKRFVAVIISAVVIVAAGIAVWYGLSHGKEPVTETLINAEDEAIYNSLSASAGYAEEYHFSAIKPENAVAAIKMIPSAQQFYAVFSAETFSGNAAFATRTKVWKNNEKYRTESQGDLNKTCICDGENVKIVNEDRRTSRIYPVSEGFGYSGEIGVADIDYILGNAESEVVSVRFARTAGIQTGGNIIYAEFYDAQTDCREEFYISVDYGVILSAQTFMGEELVYRLTTEEFIADYLSDGTMFIIKD